MNVNEKVLAAIEADLQDSGLDADVIKKQLAKMLPTDAISGEQEEVYTEDEAKMMKQYKQYYEESGNSLRGAKRKMDKMYGVKTFTEQLKEKLKNKL